MANSISINGPTELRPPRETRTYSTSQHDERSESDPSRAITMREQEELRWRFCTVESDIGIRSTFGAQLEAALAQRISDEAMLVERGLRTELTRLRKGRGRPFERKLRALKSELAAAFLAHVGPDLGTALRSNDGNAIVRPVLDVSDMSDERIHMRSPLRTVPADPYENDGVFFLVRRMREIDRRRRLIGQGHDRVLEACYGNSTAGDDWRAFNKRFGDLVDVVIAIVASKRDAKDPPARAIIRAKLTDDSFVRMMKHGASGYLRAACAAYAETRS